TYMQPEADMRIGITTIREKWESLLQQKSSTLTEGYLAGKFPLEKAEDNLMINGSVVPDKTMVERILKLKPREALTTETYIIAMRMTAENLLGVEEPARDEAGLNQNVTYHQYEHEHQKIDYPWQLFTLNDQVIRMDFERITKGKNSARLSKTNTVIKPQQVFVEKGAKVEGAIINATDGPVYIGEDAEIMEGATIRGPLALCNNAKIKMGAKIYGPVTIGPWSKVGGEVHESVIFGFSNKSHDGFLGHSVIAEWCNLGADTNTSNLKNTYEEVRLYSYPKSSFMKTGEQFIGLIMGDHSKCGINTMFNTGTVVGVNVNIYGEGFQRNFIPSFTWGSKSGYQQYLFDKAVKVAKAVYKRRGMEFDETEQAILKSVFELTARFPK
ncbi:MAG: GlmU family protein, partial [Bacteroidota bacterium]